MKPFNSFVKESIKGKTEAKKSSSLLDPGKMVTKKQGKLTGFSRVS